MGSGDLCAITAGVALMQQWSASSWNSREQVCVYLWRLMINTMFIITSALLLQYEAGW